MFNIRTRIFLLAIVALTGVASAFFIEYRDIQRQITLSNNMITVLNWVQSLSDVIHPLQKERGLTASHLASQQDTLLKQLNQQQKVTESLWEQVSQHELFKHHDFVKHFPDELQRIRQAVQSRQAGWTEVREFYTVTVQRLMELMVLTVASVNHSDEPVNEIQALPYFVNARENLGLIRATISRGYQQEHLSHAELIEISRYFGIFKDNLRVFNVVYQEHINDTGEFLDLTPLHSTLFLDIIKRIEQTLHQQTSLLSESGWQWWKDATAVIDDMKTIEAAMIEQIQNRAIDVVTHQKSYLYWYGVAASILLSLVGLLTAFTVFRILKALSILIYSLDRVERTQNFGLRIHSKAKDECGQLTLSINKLLSFTDQIIQEKDYLASTDLLTGALNRRSFIEKAEEEIKRSERYGFELSLIFCDIDYFKSINDQFGHATGDEVLKHIITIFQDNLRSHDVIGRWGGEEFVILAPQTSLTYAVKLSEKLRKKVMDITYESVEHITTSFGVAQKREGEAFTQLCERADQALYNAKGTGRNKVCTAKLVTSGAVS